MEFVGFLFWFGVVAPVHFMALGHFSGRFGRFALKGVDMASGYVMVMVDGNLGSCGVHMALVMVGDVVLEGASGFALRLEGRMHVSDCVLCGDVLNTKIEELAQLISAVGSLPTHFGRRSTNIQFLSDCPVCVWVV